MAMLTVRDVAGELGLDLVAGDGGADAPVRWVHISELLDPTPWLNGGELLLTTGMQLDTAQKQREFIAALADHRLAGVGLGIGFAHQGVPAPMSEAARARSLPLFEVPFELPFIAITELAFTRLVNEQYALLQRSNAAQTRLQQIVLSEQGLEAIAAALSGLISGTVLVLDGHGTPRAQQSFDRSPAVEVVARIGALLRERGARRQEEGASGPVLAELGERSLALAVSSSSGPGQGLPQAWLVAIKDDGPLADIDHAVLNQAVTAIALELLRERVAETTERRLAGDLLSAALAGELTGSELVRRLEPFGLGDDVGALVISSDPRGTDLCEAALSDALRIRSMDALVAQHGGLVCALLPGGPDDELFGLAAELCAAVGERAGVQIAAGAGRQVGAQQLRASWLEARFALEARELARRSPSAHGAVAGNGRPDPAVPALATHRDLGSFQLLLSLQDTDALALFCDSVLGAIERGEGDYGGELLRSLEAFIESNGHWEAAARRLYCHRHTLRYRMRKIEELTGRDLRSAQDRIDFWLALRAREIVQPMLREVVR